MTSGEKMGLVFAPKRGHGLSWFSVKLEWLKIDGVGNGRKVSRRSGLDENGPNFRARTDRLIRCDPVRAPPDRSGDRSVSPTGD